MRPARPLERPASPRKLPAFLQKIVAFACAAALWLLAMTPARAAIVWTDPVVSAGSFELTLTSTATLPEGFDWFTITLTLPASIAVDTVEMGDALPPPAAPTPGWDGPFHIGDTVDVFYVGPELAFGGILPAGPLLKFSFLGDFVDPLQLGASLQRYGLGDEGDVPVGPALTTPIPEPAAHLLMLAGLAGVALVAMRRRARP
jgi:hypothetical protein